MPKSWFEPCCPGVLCSSHAQHRIVRVANSSCLDASAVALRAFPFKQSVMLVPSVWSTLSKWHALMRLAGRHPQPTGRWTGTSSCDSLQDACNKSVGHHEYK